MSWQYQQHAYFNEVAIVTLGQEGGGGLDVKYHF